MFNLALALVLLCLPVSLKAAVEDLNAVVRAIQSSKPLRITSTLSMSVSHAGEIFESEPVQAIITIADNGTSILELGEYTAFLSDGSVVLVRKGVDDSYLRVPAGTQPAEVLHRVLGLVPFPMVTIVMDGVQREEGAFSSVHSEIDGLQLVSSNKDEQGRLSSLIFQSDDARMRISVNPDTGRPATAELDQQHPEDLPGDSVLHYEWKWSYAVPETDQIPVFIRGNRFRVDRLSALRQPGEEVASVGGQAPKLDLPALDGDRVTLTSLKGRVVVIDFWATWCGPCRKALPQLQDLAKEFSDRPVTFLTVDCFERSSGAQMRAKVAEVAESLGLTLPVLLDEDGGTAKRWGVSGIPATFIIDMEGGLAASHTGAGPDYTELLRSEIIELLSPEP